MRLKSEIIAAQDEFRSIRRTLHANPEILYEVHDTAALIAECLSRWGITVHRGIGKTGVVGTLRKGVSNRSIGLRADMDALRIQEANRFKHASTKSGAMHACGHDGHIAMLLAASKYLAENGQFDGTVNLIFQPAEEGGAGALAMVNDGLFEKFPCDAIFGVHNWPALEEGWIGSRAGALMAGSAIFDLIVHGTSGHAAMPQNSADPILAASQIVNVLQSVVSRNIDPIDSAVLSIVKFNAGTANNVIASEAKLTGAVRAFSDELLRQIEQRIREISASVAEAFGCTVSFDFRLSYPTTVNDPSMTSFAMQVASKVVGGEKAQSEVRPTMGGEDFAFMLRERPGCYAFIGNGDGTHRDMGAGLGPCELHNDSYDFNDRIIPVGASYFAELAENFLKSEAKKNCD
jgi:amidohydrolase